MILLIPWFDFGDGSGDAGTNGVGKSGKPVWLTYLANRESVCVCVEKHSIKTFPSDIFVHAF